MTITQLRTYRRRAKLLAALKAERDGLIFDSSGDNQGIKGSGKADAVSNAVLKREKIAEKIKKIEDEQMEIRIYITFCEAFYREPIFKHYVEGRSWVAIAALFGYPSPDALRVACHRYIVKNPNLGENK